METNLKAVPKYRDVLFAYIFGSEKGRKFALSLYNALNHSHYTNADDLEIITLGRVLYIKMINDAAFLLQDEMNLYEQQSTWNPNIPYRILEYAVSEYQRYISAHHYNRYSHTMFRLPAPHFVVFYNGTEEQQETSTLHLSDMFIGNKEGDLEVTVHVYNINESYNTDLKKACEALYEYCWLVERIRRGMSMAADKRDQEMLGKVVTEALDAMPEDFLIRPMLMEEKEEVKGMIFGEYNEALDRQAAEDYAKEQREIGEKEGIRQGIKQGIEQGVKQGIQQGTRQNAFEVAGNLLKKLPEWSDQEIADAAKDITAEEVAKLRRGENPDSSGEA